VLQSLFLFALLRHHPLRPVFDGFNSRLNLSLLAENIDRGNSEPAPSSRVRWGPNAYSLNKA